VAAALAACADSPELDGSESAQPTLNPPTTSLPPSLPPSVEPSTTPEPTATPEAIDVDLAGDPFTLGVASGDPTPQSVILWTRLAPLPLLGGGMPDEGFDVRWEVSTDEFETVASSGSAPAVPGLAHSIHADAAGLEPDTWYWYRFVLGRYTSAVGRTRTLPDANSAPAVLRFAFSSCQNWQAGFYAAHRHLASEDLDLMVWLGDYIYEGGATHSPLSSPEGEPRVHNSDEVTDLQGYRNRYAQYKSDSDLQASHAARPWLITWDDHEVDNDYAAAIDQDRTPIDEFLVRRAAGYQAWYEHMPVRLDPPSGTGEYRIYHDLVWGNLVRFFVLDGRQYRGDQPSDGENVPLPGFKNGQGARTLGPTALDPEHRHLGAEQENWMRSGVTRSTETWKVLAQQVMMHGLNIVPGRATPVTAPDTWDGYFANREEILQAFVDDGVDNLIVLSGDLHTATVADLRTDPFNLDLPVVGTEFMATSISSSFPDSAREAAPLLLAFNPHIKHFDPDKGYTICEVTPDTWTAHYRSLANVLDPAAPIRTAATFVVDSGTAGARRT